MYKRIIPLILSFAFALGALAESAEDIRANKSYLTGSGIGETIDLARNSALADILSKISVNVKSDFMSNESETQKNGNITSEARYDMTIKTYSSATLNNVHMMVLKPEPDAEVLMWIAKAEVDRIFQGRLNKAKEFVRIANDALEQNQIDDALRYYYWAFKLTQSLRRPNEASVDIDGEERKMLPWLNSRIESVMAGVKMNVGRKIDDQTWELNATWKDRPVSSMGYTYFDGIDNTLASMRDGRGLIEMRPGASLESVQVKMEFEFRGIAQAVDTEVYETLQAREVSRFTHAYTLLPLPAEQSAAPAIAEKPKSMGSSNVANNSTCSVVSLDVVDRCNQSVVHPIMKAIESGNITQVKGLFTDDGYDDFTKIMNYGKVRLLPESDLQYFSSQDGDVICRGLAISCRFQGRRTFTEQLSLSIDSNGKVHRVSMGVGTQLAQDIALNHTEWGEDSRKRLVDFLEDYRTAYAMKDYKYLERVFDDNAVIQVGRRNVMVDASRNEAYWQKNERVTLTKYTKDEFIKHLRESFARKEYINLIFSNSRIIKPRPNREIYSIEVKQDYYSSNYGDSGYLTLVMDLEDPANPVIHVRTWQEEPDPNFGIISIFDF